MPDFMDQKLALLCLTRRPGLGPLAVEPTKASPRCCDQYSTAMRFQRDSLRLPARVGMV
jgi:hypothetical protein